MKKSRLMLEILQTVPRGNLTAAIAAILAHRKRRAASLPDNAGVEVSVDVEAFMKTCSVRQLEMLQKIARGFEFDGIESAH